nr:glycine zipper family protein [Gordonia jinghuaiqii]
MSRIRLSAILSLAVASVTMFAATAEARPSQDLPVTYSLSHTASSVNMSVQNGEFAREDGKLVLRNLIGHEVLRIPLVYRNENRQFPIDTTISNGNATLIPSKDVSRSVELSPALVEPVRAAAQTLPQTRQQRDDEALQRMISQFSAGMTISQWVGLALGVVVGGVLGCILGAAIGCLPAIPLGASIGGIAGVVVGGGASLAVAAFHYFQTITSPFKPPRQQQQRAPR